MLSATDLDVPTDPLTFTLVTPPAHGRLVRISQGDRGGGLLQHRPLPPTVTSFTQQELLQGEGAGLTHLSIKGCDR